MYSFFGTHCIFFINCVYIFCFYSHSRSTSGKNSRYSTPPLYSRTPSYALAATPGASIGPNGRLDVDGLVPLRSDLQHRVMQLVEEHRVRRFLLFMLQLYANRIMYANL